MSDQNGGILYLTGTPIGNLEDITLRAIRILQEVDLIAAEDTRHTGKLLQHLQITTPQISYHQHNQTARIAELLQRLQEGTNIALVTDAGMPGISDPGYELVKACLRVGVKVVPIPGVTAATTALAVGGLPTDRFVFEGFLPTKAKLRSQRLQQLQTETRTIIIYEAPHRLLRSLEDLQTVLGENRRVVLARELTKLHEELWRGTIASAIAFYSHDHKPRGEYTLLIEGKEEQDLTFSESKLKQELRQLLQEGMTRSQASRHLAEITSLSRRQIYQLALEC